MPIRNKAGLPSPKSAVKRTGKTGISNSMDDAPLFAGLDGYNVKQTEIIDAKSTKAGQPRDQNETGLRQTKKVMSGHSRPGSVPKAQKSSAPVPDAILLSVAEMCALLKISRATLVRMDKSGQLPGRIKLGGSVRFHRETVETWLQSLIGKTLNPS